MKICVSVCVFTITQYNIENVKHIVRVVITTAVVISLHERYCTRNYKRIPTRN